MHLVTNVKPSADPRNLLIAPADLIQQIVIPARQVGWSPPPALSSVVAKLCSAAGAPDTDGLVAFLQSLVFEFDAPDETELRELVVEELRRQLRSPSELQVEAKAWVESVYDLSTRHAETGPLSRERIEAELRRLFGQARTSEHRLALPDHHIPREAAATAVMKRAREMGSGYLLVLGPPGCGKTTLATWIADRHDQELLLRYHVFDPAQASDIERTSRATALDFVRNLYDVLAHRFPADIAPRLPAEDRLADGVTELRTSMGHLSGSGHRFVFVDGIDHVIRAGVSRKSIFDALPRPAPDGVVFVLFGQPDWEYPPWLLRQERIELPGFTSEETRFHVYSRLGWTGTSFAQQAASDMLHRRTEGNPLSLFYNLSLVEELGDSADDILKALGSRDELFGPRPHEEYARLLDDLAAVLQAPRDSRSLKDDLLGCMAVSSTAISPSRLCLAFADDSLNSREARDFLEGMRPVLVDRGNGAFWLFHDDFRRYAEERTTLEQREASHRRMALALSTERTPDELGALAEHLWLGRMDDQLAALPRSRTLADWLAQAPSASVIALHRLAVAASFRRCDAVSIIGNALATARLCEAIDYQPADSEFAASSLGLRGWTFAIPPLGRDDHRSIQRRAAAIEAAALHCADEPAVATDIVERFAMPLDEFIEEADTHSQAHEFYLSALVEWHLRSGDMGAAQALVDDERVRGFVFRPLRELFLAERATEILQAWANALVGRQDYLDSEIAGAAFVHATDGRLDAARILADSLMRPGAVEGLTMRDAWVLGSLLGDERDGPPWEIPHGVRWNPMRSTEPAVWRDFFFDGYVSAFRGEVRELVLAQFPARYAKALRADREGDSDVSLAAFIWRCGCAAGLARRSDELLSSRDLNSVLLPLLGQGGPKIKTHQAYTFAGCVRAFLPLLAHAVRVHASLAEQMRKLVTPAARATVETPTTRSYGLFEATWVLSQDDWLSLHRTASAVTVLPGTEGYERKGWFDYWVTLGASRGAEPPTSFVNCSRIALLGVPRKTDPAALGTEIIERCLNEGHGGTELARLIDLIIRLDAEPEGGRAAGRHLPTVLAFLLSEDASSFEAEYLRTTVEYGVAESFGPCASSVASRWLRGAGDVPRPVLLALWHWIAACPGSVARDSDGTDAAEQIRKRLEALGCGQEARKVAAWISTAKKDQTENDPGHRPTHRFESGEPPRIEDIEPRWLSSWWAERENRVVREYLREHGEAGWQTVCQYLASRIGASGADYAHEYNLVASGVADLAPVLNIEAAAQEALNHLEAKLFFQEPTTARPSSAHGARTLVDVLLGLTARGLDVEDIETVRRTLWSLGTAARSDALADGVEREMRLRLGSRDVRKVRYALVVLRKVRHLSRETEALVGTLTSHPDAWCRWFACDLAQVDVQWPALRSITGQAGPIAPDLGPDKTEFGAVYFAGPTSIREVYLKRFSALCNVDDDFLRECIETEYALLPEVGQRPLGWSRQHGPTLTNERMDEAASRLACQLASVAPVPVVSALLATVAPFDPWLALATPVDAEPKGWIEFGRYEKSFDADQHEFHEHRTLALLAQGALVGPDAPAPELVARVGCSLMAPEAPKSFAWVAESWPTMRAPRMGHGPIMPLCFINSPFTQLRRDRVNVVPRWDFPVFNSLQFSAVPSPAWRSGGEVVLTAAYQERVAESGMSEHSKLSWSTAWHASPHWLRASFQQPGIRLVRIWCRERADHRWPGRSEAMKSTVTFGLEFVELGEE